MGAHGTRCRVYPRVGGETAIGSTRHGRYGGLPPRGRGNQWPCRCLSPGRRSTPAWAGKPATNLRLQRRHGVYPRVGGETHPIEEVHAAHNGLPPRGRGNRLSDTADHIGLGSTPAWAGKPGPEIDCRPETPVYPRVGGETDATAFRTPDGEGLPPRGRGNPPHIFWTIGYTGSTPAWAGKPSSLSGMSASLTVYPRVGGETVTRPDMPSASQGLPPRGRGNRLRPCWQGGRLRSTPAWAGKPAWLMSLRQALHGLPPRGRGNPGFRSTRRAPGRSTPAWAGKPSPGELKAHPEQVYPRVGGETASRVMTPQLTQGLPPRGRGNRQHGC